MDYGLTDGPDGSLDTLCFEQETGWSKLLIRQCLEHNSPNQDSVKEILGDQDITSLFSGTVIVRIENQRAADLKISKEVVDPNGSGVDFSDKEFFFTIELYDYENDTSLNESYTVTKYKDDGSGVPVEIESNIIQHGDSISLCDGEWVIIKNLPLGTYYQVTELPASGFTTYVSDHPYGHYDENSVISNTIEINNTEYLAAFRNSYNYTAPVEYGSITVSKTVTGNLGDQTKEFHFRLELSHDTEVIPDALSYVKGTDTGVIEKESDGVFIFTLAHGDTIIIQGIPLGSIYDIKETDGESSGYTITSRNASGTILGDINALFINTRHGVIPSAANTPAYSLLLSGGGICLIFAYFIYKRLKNISKK